jgi:hypothetical protein
MLHLAIGSLAESRGGRSPIRLLPISIYWGFFISSGSYAISSQYHSRPLHQPPQRALPSSPLQKSKLWQLLIKNILTLQDLCPDSSRCHDRHLADYETVSVI